MNLTKLFSFFTILALLSSCQKESNLVAVADTPVAIENLQINFEDLKSNEITKVGLEDNFRFSYDLKDEGMIKEHQLFFLVNNDESIKHVIVPEYSLEAQEIGFDHTFQGFQKIGLGNGDYYYPVSGDRLHFYFSITDDTGNVEERYFVVELE